MELTKRKLHRNWLVPVERVLADRFGDLFADGAGGGINAVFIIAIYFCQDLILSYSSNSTAAVCHAAVAAEKQFLFHHASSMTQKPMGCRVSQLVATVRIL